MTVSPTHHFHFLSNREVTSLYFTQALVRFATGLSSVFVPIFLWQLGYSISQILLFYLLRTFIYIAFAFLSLGFIRHLTDKSLLILSIPFFVGFYGLLPFLEIYPILFWIIPSIFALRDYFYNTGFHLDFSSSSDKESIGKEVGLRMIIGSLVSLSAPVLGGFLIAFTGFSNTFFLTSCILTLAILPLLIFPKNKIPSSLNLKNVWNACKDTSIMPYSISSIGYATENVINEIQWKLFLFLTIGGIQTFGGLISLGLLCSTFIVFVIGNLFDQGKQQKTFTFATFLGSILWGFRIFIVTPFGAALNHILLHFTYPAQLVSWNSQFYKLSQKAKNRAVFIVSREIITNTTRMIVLSLFIVISVFVSLEQFFAISFAIASLGSFFFLFANRQTYSITI